MTRKQNDWTPEELASVADLEAELDAKARAEAGEPPEGAITIGEHTFVREVVRGTKAVVQDAEGNTIEDVMVPFSLEQGDSEEDIAAGVKQFLADTKALEERFTDEQVADMQVSMLEDGAFGSIADVATELLRSGITVLPDEADGKHKQAIADRAGELFLEKIGEAIRDTFLADTEQAIAMRTDITLSIMTHAWAWAVADARREAELLEQLHPHRPKLTPEQFETITQRRFMQGSYASQAFMSLSVQYAESLAFQVGSALYDQAQPIPVDFMNIARAEVLGIPAPVTPNLPTMIPGFSGGFGHVSSDPISRHVVVAMQNAADGATRWSQDDRHRPYYHAHAGLAGYSATFFVSDDGDYADPAAAWALVLKQLDDETADTFHILLTQWLANRHRDPSGLAYITANDVLEQKGRAKHVNGGYRPEDKATVSQNVQAITALEVEGRNFERYESGSKGRKKKLTIAPVGKLIEVVVREDLKHLDGSRGPAVGWYYRIGPWSVVFQLDDAAAPMLARISQKIIAYDSYQAKHAKRLGRYLEWQFRTRAGARTYAQPWLISTLLSGAGIQPPDNNPGRFRERIELALDMLRDDGIIGGWAYTESPTLPARKWLPTWMRWKVTISPPEELRAHYAKIGKTTKRALPRQAGKPRPVTESPPS